MAVGVAALALAGCGGRAYGAVGAKPAAFAWLAPAPAPASWRTVRLPSGAATLSVPPGWVDLAGDTGSATVAPAGPAGFLKGFLNATPRQGAETPRGFARFRVAHLKLEGSRGVRIVAAAENLTLRGARGSCVIDDYLSHVGAHPYREIACIGGGQHAGAVVVAALPRAAWTAGAPLLEAAVCHFRFGG